MESELFSLYLTPAILLLIPFSPISRRRSCMDGIFWCFRVSKTFEVFINYLQGDSIIRCNNSVFDRKDYKHFNFEPDFFVHFPKKKKKMKHVFHFVNRFYSFWFINYFYIFTTQKKKRRALFTLTTSDNYCIFDV